jgi:hypothetical protein
MRLYVEPMDVTVVEVAADGKVRIEGEGWIDPNLQERRALIYAAEKELEALRELLDLLA